MTKRQTRKQQQRSRQRSHQPSQQPADRPETPTSGDTVVHVGGASPYYVVIGQGLAGRLPALLGASVERVAVLYAGTLGALADPVVDALVEHYDVLALGLPDGERAKAAPVASDCWEALGEAGFTRSDAVVTIGGGATTDLGGFVAATWLRGVRVVHVPTTLLAMVDAAVGGKTGINTGAGKNLVGSFHEPAGVLCDLALLETLPHEELVAGLGEVVKCGFIADPAILDVVERTDPAALTWDSAELRELVERAVRVKVDVVVDDLRETGGADGHPGREVLNYGHTLAHAIERTSDYAVRHGEAVAIGCVYVAELAARAGSLAPALVERHRAAFGRVGLPTSYDAASFDDLHAAMKVDKKARGSQLRFVVLDDLASPRILAGPDEDDLRAAYAAIGRTS
jgi:3-dehydroquinate synthase